MDDVCIRNLRHKHIGCANVNTLKMLTHLHDDYARTNSSTLKENYARINQQCDPNKPICNLIDQVEDTVDCAATGNTSCTAQ